MLSGFTLTTTVPALALLYRRQRAAAPGAWRLHAGLARLVIGGLLAVPICLRAFFWDLYWLNLRPHRLRDMKRRVRKARALLSRRPPAGAPRRA